MNDIGKRTVGVISGIGIAILLGFCAVGLVHLSFHFVPWTNPERFPWIATLLLIGLPETAFIVAAVRLWRKRRPMAVGILVSAVVIGTHLIMHVAHEWSR